MVTSASASLPRIYDPSNWSPRKTPLALLTEYKQKRRWKTSFSFSHTGHNAGPFLATLFIPDLHILSFLFVLFLFTYNFILTQPVKRKFTPALSSKQLKAARQQAA